MRRSLVVSAFAALAAAGTFLAIAVTAKGSGSEHPVGVPGQARTAMYKMYTGFERIGWLRPSETGDPLWRDIDCDELGSVAINARGTWIYVNDYILRHRGFARLQEPGRWAIYRWGFGLAGFAKQRTSRRWNVYDSHSRLYGYTLGPDGPQAAAVLLTFC